MSDREIVRAVLVQHKVLADGTTAPDLTQCSQAQGETRDVVRRLISKAKEDWKGADHLNWSIRDMDSAAFLDSHMQPGQVMLFIRLDTCCGPDDYGVCDAPFLDTSS